VLLIYVPVLAQDDPPPPLGYASLSEYYQRYHIYDFKTQAVQTIERDVPLGENKNYYCDSTPPAVVRIQSPYDPLIQFEFESTETPELDVYVEYNLYRLASDGTRQLIAVHANVPYPEKEYWSPNGDYLYFKTDTQRSGIITLNRLNLHTNQLTPLKQHILALDNCQSGAAWCILQELGVGSGVNYPVTLSVLNRDDGTLQPLGTSVLIFTSTMWLGTGSELLYAIAPTVDHYAIHRYDAATHTNQLLAEIEARYMAGWQLSPDAHWLVVQAAVGKEISNRLYALNMKTIIAVPILLTKQFAQVSQSPVTSLRWLDDHILVYSTYDKDKGRGIYSATFPGGQIRELAHFDHGTDFFDHDWSPDGRWLVLSEYEYTKDPARIYLVSMDGGSRQIMLPDAKDQQICVGWFSDEIYNSQKANLCDMTLGEG